MAGIPTRSRQIAWSELESIASTVQATESDAICGRIPKYMVTPSTAEEVAAVLRWANENSVALAARGNGTKLGWGAPPRALDVVLSMRKMNRIIEHAWGDMTATVEPGCTVAELERTLAQHGQRLAVEPLFAERATVGGVVATNDNGPVRVRFGSLRDLIIGVTLALPDGTLARSGGKVVKNVAGYDLPKLVTGSLGTLGIITQVIFRLHPLPQTERTLSFQFESVAAANHAALALLDSVLTFTGLQLRSSGQPLCTLDVRFEGIENAVEDQAQRAGRIVSNRLSVAGDRLLPAETGQWKSSTALWGGSPCLICRFSVLPSEIASLIERAHSLSEPLAVRTHAVAQAVGVGLLRLDGAADDLLPIIRELRQLASLRHGSLVVLHAPAELHGRLDPWGEVGTALGTMRRMKQQFDPKGILNRGRFVGGI
jgi:glycolate oxidase FAD binding subunit